MVAICLAASAGFHGPGSNAAITLSFFVAASSAWLKATDSVLEFCAVAGRETDLAQSIIETTIFSDLCQTAIVIDVPAGTLLYLADDEPSGHVWNPVCKLYLITQDGHGNYLDVKRTTLRSSRKPPSDRTRIAIYALDREAHRRPFSCLNSMIARSMKRSDCVLDRKTQEPRQHSVLIAVHAPKASGVARAAAEQNPGKLSRFIRPLARSDIGNR